MAAARKDWHRRNPQSKMSPEERLERRRAKRVYDEEQARLIQPSERPEVARKRAERQARKEEKARRRREYERRVMETTQFKASLKYLFSILLDRWNGDVDPYYNIND